MAVRNGQKKNRFWPKGPPVFPPAMTSAQQPRAIRWLTHFGDVLQISISMIHGKKTEQGSYSQ